MQVRGARCAWVAVSLVLGGAAAAGATGAEPAPPPPGQAAGAALAAGGTAQEALAAELLARTERTVPARATPRQALRLFIESARMGDYGRAGEVLELPGIAEAERAEVAPRLARKLKLVLDQKLWIEWEKVSDAHGGDPADGPDRDVIGTVPLGDEAVPIVLARSLEADGRAGWRIAASTVARIPALEAAYGAGWIGEHVPEVLFHVRVFEVEAWQWIGLCLALLAAWLAGVLLAGVGLAVADRVTKRTAFRWDERLVGTVRAPARFFLALVVVGPLLELLRLSAPAQSVADQLRSTLLVIAVAWLATRFVRFVAETAQDTLASGVTDEGQLRGIRTQVVVLRRVASVIVVTVAAALVLTQFEVVRDVGMSLLASAGIAGIVLGLAAQKTISTLLAGIQLSITQPVRIGDTVIVEDEWGWIEEIHLTYVVVKVWDLRRLVVPIGRFLDQPFQNWTKVSPEILGTVELYADFAVPIDAVRAELKRLCESSAHWDKKACGLQVTGVSEHTVTLRALVSSADAGANWDLRCDVREGLVKFLQGLEGGRYLPRTRVDLPEPAPANLAKRVAPELR